MFFICFFYPPTPTFQSDTLNVEPSVSVTLTRKCYSNYSAPSLLAVKLPALGAGHGARCTSLAFSLTGRRKESEIAERGRARGLNEHFKC